MPQKACKVLEYVDCVREYDGRPAADEAEAAVLAVAEFCAGCAGVLEVVIYRDMSMATVMRDDLTTLAVRCARDVIVCGEIGTGARGADRIVVQLETCDPDLLAKLEAVVVQPYQVA